MNRSFSKIRHIQEANLLMETRRLVENNRSFLIESDQNSINTQLVNNYVNAVKTAMTDYSNVEGFKDSSQNNGTATIFGQTFYTTPLTLPNQKDKVLTYLRTIQDRVIGIGVQGKELQARCIPQIKNGTSFKDGHACFSFQNTNGKFFQNYAKMNAAYDALVNSINNIQK
jgi:hypothetical protein